jgi:hypothetical protein
MTDTYDDVEFVNEKLPRRLEIKSDHVLPNKENEPAVNTSEA